MTDMIVGLLDLVSSLIQKLPELSIDSAHLSSMSSAFSTIIDFLVKANYVVPIDTILLITSIVYGFRVVKFGVFVVNWIIRRLVDAVP